MEGRGTSCERFGYRQYNLRLRADGLYYSYMVNETGFVIKVNDFMAYRVTHASFTASYSYVVESDSLLLRGTFTAI